MSETTIEEHEMETIAQHVEAEIRALFGRVAEMVERGEVGAELGPDDTAGIPLALMDAEQTMVGAWRRYVDGGAR